MKALETCRPVGKLSYDPLPDAHGSPNPAEYHALEQVKDNLYRYSVDAAAIAHTALILVTDEGIILTDPIRTSGALWLRDELKKQFNKPVKYVIYSHAHYDHIGGGQVFQKEGAVIIAHENAIEPIIGERLPTALPNLVFSEKTSVQLGGEKVELTYVAPNHSNSNITIHFPKQRTMMAVDFCPIGYLPYNDFLDFYYDGWMKSLRWLNQQDFDILEGGHYALGTKKDVPVQIDYMEHLHSEVMKQIRNGCCWDLLWRKIQFKPEHTKLGGFERMRILNILGMYRWCENHRRGLW